MPMDTAAVDSRQLLSPRQLADNLGRADAPLIFDARKAPAFDAAQQLVNLDSRRVPGAIALLALGQSPPRSVRPSAEAGRRAGRRIDRASRARSLWHSGKLARSCQARGVLFPMRLAFQSCAVRAAIPAQSHRQSAWRRSKERDRAQSAG